MARMHRHLLSLLLLLMLSLPGLPAECAQKCEEFKACCCCAEETASAETAAGDSVMDCCSPESDSSRDNKQDDRHFRPATLTSAHKHSGCSHECSLSSAGDLASSISSQQVSTPATPVLTGVLPEFPLQLEVSVQRRLDRRMPLHLASNKIYLRNRHLLI